MSDAVLFTLLFAGIFTFRIIIATVAFLVILPRGDSCPNCDRSTVRIASFLFDRLLPWFRKSWCLTCGWHGLLRRGDITAPTPDRQLSARR